MTVDPYEHADPMGPLETTGLIRKQLDILRRPLNTTRIAKRSQGGKQLSYLEAWDVRAHLIRVFGYGNFDIITSDAHLIYQRDIEVGSEKKAGWEVAWSARVTLVIRDPQGDTVCEYAEYAVGSASGSVDLGGLHDNAVKQAESDAMKRCAINLGTQFGLSLYDDGSTRDVVRGTALDPEQLKTEDQVDALKRSLGAEVVSTEEPS